MSRKHVLLVQLEGPDGFRSGVENFVFEHEEQLKEAVQRFSKIATDDGFRMMYCRGGAELLEADVKDLASHAAPTAQATP